MNDGSNHTTKADWCKSVYWLLASRVGAPEPPPDRWQWLQAQAQLEDTAARYNLLATTRNEPGSTNFNSAGVQNYPSYTAGVRATVETLMLSYYKHVVLCLFDPQQPFGYYRRLVHASPWSGSDDYWIPVFSKAWGEAPLEGD